MSMLTDIGTYLAAEIGSLTLGTNLFLGQMPESPDDVTVLYARPGMPPDFSLGAPQGSPQTPNWENKRLQVVVRKADSQTAYPDGETLIDSIWRKLMLTEATLSGTRYLLIEPKDDPAPLEEDKKGRLSFVANFDVMKEPA